MLSLNSIVTTLKESLIDKGSLILFIFAVSIVLPYLFKKFKRLLRKVKTVVVYHYVGILVLAIIPIIQDFLLKQEVIHTIPSFGSINAITIIMWLVSLNLTRIISKQLIKIF